MFNFGSDYMRGVFDHLGSRAEARKGQWTVTEKVDDARLQGLQLKSDFVDALLVGQRDMTFKEAAEFLIFNGVSVPSDEIIDFFVEAGLLAHSSGVGVEVTPEGWKSECLREEEEWKQPEQGLSECRRLVLVTVKGQLLLAKRFLFNDGKGGKR